MNTQLDFFDINKDVNWITTKRSSMRAKTDVSLTVGSKGKITITFRNEIWKCISDTDFVKLGILKNRIIFAEAEEDGYKLVRSKSTEGSRYIFPSCEALADFGGNYELKYESFHDYYYIEKEK